MVMKAIAELEIKLWTEQKALERHKGYFKALLHDNLMTLSALVLPAFLMGWGIGGTANTRVKLMRLARFALMSTLSHIKK